jgi:AcrR family transcriptional regulator
MAQTVKRRRRRSGSKKKTLLLETALRLFLRYGMKRVTVGEVCEQANVSKVTFYKHFENKVELAKQVIDLLWDRVAARVDEIVALDQPFSRKVELLVEERVRMAKEWSGEFVAELYHADPELAALIAQRAARSRERYLDFIRAGQARGELRADLHPEVVLAVVDKLYELGGDAELVRKAGGFDRLTRDVNTVFFFGVLPREA